MSNKIKRAYVQMHKYYDWSRERPLDKSDGAPFSDWMADPNHPAPLAVHPEGFLVSLRPDEIRNLDEYSDGDPYKVADKKDSPFHKQRICATLEMVANAIPKQMDSPKILDVACGEGHITAAIQDKFPQAEISAFDASLSAVSSASKTYPGITFDLANAYDPPYRPDYFDCVVCNNIWEHVPDPLHLLARLSRLLKPNGYLIISTPSRYNLNNLFRILVGKPVALMSCHHVTEYSVGQVLEQMRWGGFSVEKILSELIGPEKHTIRTVIKYSIATIFKAFLRLSHSHHRLGSTVFYLARKSKTQ